MLNANGVDIDPERGRGRCGRDAAATSRWTSQMERSRLRPARRTWACAAAVRAASARRRRARSKQADCTKSVFGSLSLRVITEEVVCLANFINLHGPAHPK